MRKSFLLTLFALTAVSAVSAAALKEANPQKAWRPARKSAPQKSVAATPKIVNEKMVVCGNKKMLLTHDGKIVLSNAAAKIADIQPYTSFEDKETGKTDWGSFTSDLCSAKLVDGKIVWVLNKKIGGKKVKVAEQTLEVMPDGLIKLCAQFENIDTDERKIKTKGSIFINVPIAGNEGRKVLFNDSKTLAIAKTLKHGEWKPKSLKYQVFPDSPVDTFTVSGVKPEFGTMGIGRVGKDIRISCGGNKEFQTLIYIDLRKSGVENIDAANTGAGVDFKCTENLELPYKDKNLLYNSSFEQNKLGWVTQYHLTWRKGIGEEKWHSDPFRIVTGGVHGKHALRLKGIAETTKRGDYRNLIDGINLSSPTVFLNPGKYTVSFYAKQSKGDKLCYFNVWNHSFAGTMFLPPHKSGKFTTRLTRNWKRYSFVVEMPKAAPTAFSFNVNGVAEVMLDAVQIEAGTKMTAYSSPVAQGLLITSADDNFISAKEKVNARVRICTTPMASGKVDIRVKNFFNSAIH